MRHIQAIISHLFLAFGMSLLILSCLALSSPGDTVDAGIRCQGTPPDCKEVLACTALSCCDTVIIIRVCGCFCF